MYIQYLDTSHNLILNAYYVKLTDVTQFLIMVERADCQQRLFLDMSLC